MRWTFRGLRRASTEDYSGVLVPLEEAHLYSHSARKGRTESEDHLDRHNGETNGKQDDDDEGHDEEEGTGMLELKAAEYSIAGLRKEVRRGARGKWTDYESE
jgi:hypothetical protein